MMKGAALLGIGLNNVVSVPCDSKGCMDVQVLEQMVVNAKEQVCRNHIHNTINI